MKSKAPMRPVECAGERRGRYTWRAMLNCKAWGSRLSANVCWVFGFGVFGVANRSLAAAAAAAFWLMFSAWTWCWWTHNHRNNNNGYWLSSVCIPGTEHGLHSPDSGFKWQALIRTVTLCLTPNSIFLLLSIHDRLPEWGFQHAYLTMSLPPKLFQANRQVQTPQPDKRGCPHSALCSLKNLTPWHCGMACCHSKGCSPWPYCCFCL